MSLENNNPWFQEIEERITAKEQTDEIVAGAMNLLTPIQARRLGKRVFRGMTYGDIPEDEGVSNAVARSAVIDAKHKLRTKKLHRLAQIYEKGRNQ